MGLDVTRCMSGRRRLIEDGCHFAVGGNEIWKYVLFLGVRLVEVLLLSCLVSCFISVRFMFALMRCNFRQWSHSLVGLKVILRLSLDSLGLLLCILRQLLPVLRFVRRTTRLLVGAICNVPVIRPLTTRCICFGLYRIRMGRLGMCNL